MIHIAPAGKDREGTRRTLNRRFSLRGHVRCVVVGFQGIEGAMRNRHKKAPRTDAQPPLPNNNSRPPDQTVGTPHLSPPPRAARRRAAAQRACSPQTPPWTEAPPAVRPAAHADTLSPATRFAFALIRGLLSRFLVKHGPQKARERAKPHQEKLPCQPFLHVGSMFDAGRNRKNVGLHVRWRHLRISRVYADRTPLPHLPGRN